MRGLSDLHYLKAFSEALRLANRSPLDRRRTICPAGGIDKVGTFMALFGSNKLHVAMLVDFVKGQKRKVEDLRKSSLMHKSYLFTANTYADAEEGDTEDIFGKDFYLTLVNKAYDLKDNKKLDVTKLGNSRSRAVTIVEEHFRTVAIERTDYDHYLPSSFLCENRSALFKELPGVELAIAGFEMFVAASVIASAARTAVVFFIPARDVCRNVRSVVFDLNTTGVFYFTISVSKLLSGRT